MLWLEQYRPKSFSEIITHRDTVTILEKYILETMPNLIIHGQDGHNKRTMLNALISHLYGKFSDQISRTMEIEAGSATLTVSYLESDEVIEICPSEYGYKDRFVVQSVIKEMAKTRPIQSFFGTMKKSIKILIIDQAEDLSKDAQAALRRTIEVYSNHFRIIMLTTETSKIIDPIKSRCLMIRMRGFSNDEISEISKAVLKNEKIEVPIGVIEDISQSSNGDCKKALCLLELHCFNMEDDKVKKQKVSYINFKLEWETRIENIIGFIKNSPKPESMAEIRKELYALLGSNIPASVILIYMMKGLTIKASFEVCKTLSAFALGYEERIRQGTKPLYHLEAFAATSMLLLSQKK